MRQRNEPAADDGTMCERPSLGLLTQNVRTTGDRSATTFVPFVLRPYPVVTRLHA